MSVRFQSSDMGKVSSSETRFLKFSAPSHSMNSSIEGIQESSPEVTEFLVFLGSVKLRTAWSMFKDLNGDERLEPKMPMTYVGFPGPLKTKQLWMYWIWFFPTGVMISLRTHLASHREPTDLLAKGVG